MKGKVFVLWCLLVALVGFNDQEREQIESEIIALLRKARTIEDVKAVIDLVYWETDIIYKIPSVPPYIPDNYRNVRIGSRYGKRIHPITAFEMNHKGIDIPLSYRDTICAAADGRVLHAGYDTKLGCFVKVKHSYGYESIYGHLSDILVMKGDSVVIGQGIGLCGSTGLSTGNHLHYAVKKNGLFYDPEPYYFLMYDFISKNNI